MFFYIGQECPIRSIDKVADNLFLDKGWKYKNINNTTYWYKGYSTDCVLSQQIAEIVTGYKPNGKYCVISEKGDLFHPTLRGFPVYTNNEKILTNIPLSNLENVAYDTQNIKRTKTISLEEASTQINEILKENVVNFFRYNKIEKLNVLFSAGIDTLTVWSIVDSLGYDYNLHIHTPKHNDIFGVKQEYESDLIDLCREKFWGYKMTSCFTQENWYATGFYSERMQLREVTQGHTIANYLGKKLHLVPDKKDYLYYFLQRPKLKINNEPTFKTESEVIDWCIKSVFFDHQMWHIDHNYHFSPFNDIRITEIICQLSLDDIIKNSLNAIVQKNIISYNRRDFLQLLPSYKNEGNIWGNYKNNFDKIVLRDSVKKYIT